MNAYKKLLKNFFSISMAQFSSKLMAYFLIPIYTYVLTTGEYGTYDLLSTTVSLLLPVITLDIAEGCFRFAMDENYEKKQIFSIGFYICILTLVISVALYPILSYVKEIKAYYFFFVCLILFDGLYTFLMQFIKGCQQIKFYSLCGVLNTVIMLISNIIFLVVIKIGLIGYLLAYIIAPLLVSIIILIRIKFPNYIVSPVRLDWNTVKHLLRYTVPMIPNSICWWVSNSSDKYMLRFMTGTAMLGIYSISYKIPSVMSIVGTIFMGAWSISAIEDFGSARSQKMFSDIYNAYFGILVMGSSFLILLSEPLASFLYQKEFFIAWKSSAILIAAFVFNGLAGFLGTVYTAAKKTKMLFLSTLIAAGTNIILNLCLIPSWGIYGAAIATLVSYIVVWIIRLIHSRRYLKINFQIIPHMLSILLVSAVIAVVYAEMKFSYLYAGCMSFVIVMLNIKNVLKMLRNSKNTG